MEQNGDDHQWINSLHGTFTHDIEEANFIAQLFNTTTNISHHDPFMASLDHHDDQVSSSSFYRLSQESSDHDHHQFSGGNYNCSQLLLFPTENDSFCNNNNPMNFSLGAELEDHDHHNNNGGGFDHHMLEEMSESNLQACNSEADFIKLPDHEEISMDGEEGHNDQLLQNNCKKRISKGSDLDVQKKRNERTKKTQKITSSSNTEEDGNAGPSRQSTSNYCSEDESNASLEQNRGANNTGTSPKGPTKSRASRGSATDPQSIYARKRRERINERLRILQNLVPNGTKVDISTMLEEAVQYVKFLQLQIKLLSSDDLWMYAPIAYNGMDIGLNRTPNTPKEL